MASNLSWPTIMPACGQHCARFWRRRPISAATCIFCANALDHVPRKSLPSRKRGWTTTACRSCAGWEPVLGPAKPDPGDRRDLTEARRDPAAWLAKWAGKESKLNRRVEDHIDEN